MSWYGDDSAEARAHAHVRHFDHITRAPPAAPSVAIARAAIILRNFLPRY